jgi:putative FmdB family regulatory protein
MTPAHTIEKTGRTAEVTMPLFEYLCLACGQGFEKLQKSADEEAPPCPACGAAKVQRQLSTFAAKTPSPSHSGCSGGG